MAGRPRKEVAAIDLPKIEILAGYGLSEEKIARTLDMDGDTFSKRKWEDPAILRAVEKGKAVAESIVGQSLFNKAKAGDLGAIVWYEKTRCGRVDTSQVRHANAEGGNLNDTDAMTDEQRIERVTKILSMADARRRRA